MTMEISRRRALATTACLIAAPAILRTQEARVVRIVQQRGLLYLPVDIMASGGLIAKHAARMDLGRVAAKAGVINSAPAVNDAVPPFTERGLRLPGAHLVLDSHQVFGGSFTQMMLVGPRRFRDQNPRLQKAVLAALDEAVAMINTDKRAAVSLWKDVHKASESVDEL